ncbi:MAG: 3-dehydroquinate synthase [Candidatus Omnitrophota bacterium]
MNKIKVSLGKRSYDILVSYNKVDEIGAIIKRLKIGTDAIVITNPAIKKLYLKKVRSSLVVSGFNVREEIVPDSEKAKSELYCIKLLNNISKIDNSKKRIFVIALGGGVIGDLSGFVASIYRRGIPYVQIPTTLLAQVDSAIGGKVAIDLAVGKNLAGSFYQPKLVISDASFLKSLPKKDLISGLSEVIKYGVIRSPGLFRSLEKDIKKIIRGNRVLLERIIFKCSLIKAAVVEKDERDNKNVRVILNFGHTIGHAIESASGYSKTYSHGQAIALGMLAASFISRELGILKEKDLKRIKKLIKKAGLPIKLKKIAVDKILKLQEHDKKFIHGKNRFVLPAKIGKVVIKEGVPVDLVRRSILSLL